MLTEPATSSPVHSTRGKTQGYNSPRKTLHISRNKPAQASSRPSPNRNLIYNRDSIDLPPSLKVSSIQNLLNTRPNVRKSHKKAISKSPYNVGTKFFTSFSPLSPQPPP